ncbi:MAG TPA: amino acid adenylation domain-containing protein [Aliidongia sp.]|nr:amino acid adenylation domain-containing protein [Aliidongia sp.]
MELANTGASLPAGREQQYPCSLAQERFWILDRLLPGNPALNIAVRWRLVGKISTNELEQAFRLILSRHEVLRTAFLEQNGELTQVIRVSVPFRLPVIDLSNLTEDAAEAEMERLAKLEARGSFDLADPPFLRVTQVRVRDDQSVLLVTVHHIVADGWSIGVLAREMGEICAALQSGRLPTLPPLSLNYGDFARHQRESLSSADFQADADFWRSSLGGMKHFELQTDFPRPLEQTSNGSIVSILMPRSTTDGFAQLARRNGCTMYMAALATLYTLLHRYSGETDIAVGTQIAGRDEVDVENLVGLFINTLILRADLSGDPTYTDLLDRISDLVGDAFEHQRVPLERVIEIVAPRRDLSRNALFSVNFIFQRSFITNATYGDFKLIDMPSRSAGALYDLNFFMVERPEGWRISCEYNTDLFETATAQRLIEHFRNLLVAATTEPDTKISALSILSDAERSALIVEANDTAAPYPHQTALPELFMAQAKKTPASVAVTCGRASLTYEQLDHASSLLAQHLLALGVEGGLVGVMLERSVELPVALLGIMKAGAAYVPLDPAYPTTRLVQIVDDAGLAAMVTHSGLRERLPTAGLPRLEMDRLPDAPSPRPLPEIAPDARAYVIFTSGSTGRPKGVQIPHRALVNLLWAMRERPGLAGTDVLLSVTTISFDIAALEIYLPLIVGARLVMATAAQTVDGRELLALLEREKATVLQATPVTWELLIEAGWQHSPALKMLCGGEALSRRLANQMLERGGELWNMYGPTETTIWSSAYRVTSGKGPVPIGGIIANTQFYVVDALGGLVPPGAPGELVIGGDGVAIGYLGRDDLTKARFYPDSFRRSAGARLYRTGDIVRSRRPGEIEYLGRTDHQVKLRGFRIELGEIEAAILANPDIAEAVATIHRPVAGEPSLAAYVVVAAAHRRSAAETVAVLRNQLAQSLPKYMQPQYLTVLDSLPRTPNGKTDREALPPPVVEQPAAQEASPPFDKVEQRLAVIWQSVLGLNAIDKGADFFELGGHSLLAARLLLRVEAEFGQKISLANLFKSPTLESMARLLKQTELRQHDFRQVVRLQTTGQRAPVIGINNTGLYFTLSKRLGHDHPFTALQLFDPSFSREQMPDSFEAIAEQYLTLIREVQPTGPYALVGWCVGGALAFEVARQLAAAGEEISLLALIDTWAPGYLKDLGPIKGRFADYAYRVQLILQDWSRASAQPGGIGRFIRNRSFVRKLGRLFGWRGFTADLTLGAQGRYVTADGYDQWLLKFLQQTISRYRPGHYSGKITILRSEEEPRGLFLDKTFGWQRFTDQSVEAITITGDHFSIFTEPGVDQMAREISKRLEAFEVVAGASRKTA